MASPQPNSSRPFLHSMLGTLAALALVAACAGAAFTYLIVIFSLSAGGKKKDQVPSQAVLVLDLSMNLRDAPPERAMAGVVDEVLFGSSIPQLYLLEVVDAIERASKDPNIKGLFLTGSFLPSGYGSGLAALREVRQAIEGFQTTGKPVYAYTLEPSLRDYYLMSAADHLAINPFGLVPLNGLAAEGIFLGQAFEKYGIGVQTTRVGRYKSAVEMFTSDRMSPEDREQVQVLIDDLWSQILTEISLSRHIDPALLRQEADREGFFSANDALELGLVNQVAYLDEVLDQLTSLAGEDDTWNTFSQINVRDYITARGFANDPAKQGTHGTTIAVLYAEGDIVSGEGSADQAGGERLARELRALRQDCCVAAVVLRVNSPGGSAVAAELIEREVQLTREVKPVVVSMGALAASGGYWIAAPANHIFAEPYTITGSIGVWGLLFNIKTLANRHGVTFDGVKSSPFADIFTVSRAKTPEEMERIQEFTDFIYDAFIDKVARGRDMPAEQVETLAQGRVWTGRQALELGLVDQLGGLEDAIVHAAGLAVPDQAWTIRQIPEKRTLGEAILEILESGSGPAPIVSRRPGLFEQTLARLQNEWSVLQSFNDPRGIYARLPWQLVLE